MVQDLAAGFSALQDRNPARGDRKTWRIIVTTSPTATSRNKEMALEADGVELRGDTLKVATAVNQLVDRLRAVSSEVTRVARQVGTEGQLGAQADVRDVSGTWKELTDNVNLLAGNLTAQVRNIAAVTTAVATGRPLSRKLPSTPKAKFSS